MTRSPRHGLIIGKFYPPHLGHHALIEAAERACEPYGVELAARFHAQPVVVDLGR